MTSAPANSGQNVFTALAALGYPATVPIIPPGASVSPRSTLAKRIDTPSDGRGKSPGIRHRDGLWSGFDWLPYCADARDYERWHDMGAGTGIKTGAESGVVVLDADTENEEYAGVIKGVIERVCGLSPVRIGKYPKALYVFRTEAGGVVPQYRRVEFGKVNGKGVPERVELLSDGRQFVAAGVHNRTGLPYRWARALCAWGDLPVLTEAQAGRVMTELTAVLPLADIKTEGGGAEVVDQGTLLGEPSAIARAVRALPNTDESHPSREDYLGVGYAIKAALGPDRISEGFDLWAEWCERKYKWYFARSGEFYVNQHGILTYAGDSAPTLNRRILRNRRPQLDENGYVDLEVDGEKRRFRYLNGCWFAVEYEVVNVPVEEWDGSSMKWDGNHYVFTRKITRIVPVTLKLNR